VNIQNGIGSIKMDVHTRASQKVIKKTERLFRNWRAFSVFHSNIELLLKFSNPLLCGADIVRRATCWYCEGNKIIQKQLPVSKTWILFLRKSGPLLTKLNISWQSYCHVLLIRLEVWKGDWIY
jgi:hypothetical protein